MPIKAFNTDGVGLSSGPCRDARRDKKQNDRLCKDTEYCRVKQKVRKKQNDVRYDIGKTRVVVEIAVTSLAAKQINKGHNNSRITCANYT